MRSLARSIALVLILSFVASAPVPVGAATTDTFPDEGGSDSAFVVVTIELSNQPPVTVVTGDTETGGSDPLPPEVTDPDGDEIITSADEIPDGANLIDDDDGDTSVTVTPDVRPPELTHQIYEIEGVDALLATELTAQVAIPSPPTVRLTPREGLMVAFGSAVETLKSQIVPALILGVVMAWMLMIGVGRVKEEEEEPA